MTPQEEQSRKRKSGEALMNAAATVAHKPRIRRPRIIRRPRPDNCSEDASGASGTTSTTDITPLTLDHSLTSCPETKHDLPMQLEFIQMRANMPSFQPTQDWVDVVHAAVADGHKPPNSFPWTAQFTIKLYKSLEPFKRDLDKVGIDRRVGLPIDPYAKDWETVQRNFS
ncbi:hypothetical protein FACUT_8444 [Fusarium acutatum]|uniref:Uncharacterized protein n=1 Tax=Fusarium acutatum TaxID=78861 RepID=A0A8H4JJL6_9HYPO|nr:hypothetical protein FACUT_8444 [Fusarium acutatum]